MNITLGPRLRALAEHVPNGCRLADIGSDHGYLPAWLLTRQMIISAVAGDINADPARRALETCRACGLEDRMFVRVGSGMQVLGPGDADVIVVAGMGGTTMREILQDGLAQLAGVRRLILQPQVAAAELRQWLCANGFAIVDETLVAENDIIYEVIVAEPGDVPALNWLDALLGPVIRKRQSVLLARRVSQLIAEREHILRQLGKSESAGAVAKQLRLSEEITALKQLLADNQTSI